MKGKLPLLAIITLILISCNTEQKKAPLASKGVLDLRDWNFEKDGILGLYGEWDFYWQQFLSGKDFDSIKTHHYIDVPVSWKSYKWNNEALGFEGYATYHLRILVNNKTKNFGIKFPDQGTAFQLFVNDSLAGKNGKIGKTREEYAPQEKPLVIYFKNYKNVIDLTLKVTNYDFHYKSGLIYIPFFGSEEAIWQKKEHSLLIDIITIVSLSTCAIVLMIFFVLRTREKASLVFSFVCILGIIRTVTFGERMITDILPFLGYELMLKFEILGWVNTAIFIWLYIKLLFPKETSTKLLITIIILFGTIDLITIITPAKINSYFILPGQSMIALLIPLLLFIAIIALKRKREGALILFLSFCIFAFAAGNEILFWYNIMPIIIPYPAALVIWSLSQITILSQRFSNAFKRVENFAEELKIEIEEKTKDLRNAKEISELERNKSESLLLNVLPEQIAGRLKEGETTIADHFDEASIIFIDIADFTKISAKTKPQIIVHELNKIFTIFDKISAKYGLEKIKTIGDCYMAAAGIPEPRTNHAEAVASMAMEVMEVMGGYQTEDGYDILFRIGLDCGPVVAGVIGEKKFIYDLWGDPVNTASRMEYYGVIGKIQCTERFRKTLTSFSGKWNQGEEFIFHERGLIDVKGKGTMKTWFLEGEN